MPPIEHRPVDRRRFLRSTTAAAAAALPLSTASAAANERIGVAFLGCGGRAQAHMHLAKKFAGEGLGVVPVAVCDVWDGIEEEYDQHHNGSTTRRKFSQGLYPAAGTLGLDARDRTRVTKDYRRVLDRKDVDAVVIATPDHWHAKMVLDAIAAGKDVLVETPLARTPEEAVAVRDAAAASNRVVSVCCPTLADPSWSVAREQLRTLGPAVHLSASVFRSDPRGLWRFYRVVPEMTARSIDWDLFLGHRFEVNGVPLGPTPTVRPFDRTVFAQWRCYAPFSGGPFTDLFTAPITRLLAAASLGFATRVSASGGLYHERDGRTVPDVGTISAEFPGGCHLTVTGSTAASGFPVDDAIRCRNGAIAFAKGGLRVFRGGTETFVPVESPKNETEAIWRNFLTCVRTRDRATLSPPSLGAAAASIVGQAVRSLG